MDASQKDQVVGRWSDEEHAVFVDFLQKHGRNWKLLASLIPSRTVVQIRTHAQKFFQKLEKQPFVEEWLQPYVESHKSYGVASGRGDTLLARRTPRTPQRLGINDPTASTLANDGSTGGGTGTHGGGSGRTQHGHDQNTPRGTPGAEGKGERKRKPRSQSAQRTQARYAGTMPHGTGVPTVGQTLLWEPLQDGVSGPFNEPLSLMELCGTRRRGSTVATTGLSRTTPANSPGDNNNNNNGQLADSTGGLPCGQGQDQYAWEDLFQAVFHEDEDEEDDDGVDGDGDDVGVGSGHGHGHDVGLDLSLMPMPVNATRSNTVVGNDIGQWQQHQVTVSHVAAQCLSSVSNARVLQSQSHQPPGLAPLRVHRPVPGSPIRTNTTHKHARDTHDGYDNGGGVSIINDDDGDGDYNDGFGYGGIHHNHAGMHAFKRPHYEPETPCTTLAGHMSHMGVMSPIVTVPQQQQQQQQQLLKCEPTPIVRVDAYGDYYTRPSQPHPYYNHAHNHAALKYGVDGSSGSSTDEGVCDGDGDGRVDNSFMIHIPMNGTIGCDGDCDGDMLFHDAPLIPVCPPPTVQPHPSTHNVTHTTHDNAHMTFNFDHDFNSTSHTDALNPLFLDLFDGQQ